MRPRPGIVPVRASFVVGGKARAGLGRAAEPAGSAAGPVLRVYWFSCGVCDATRRPRAAAGSIRRRRCVLDAFRSAGRGLEAHHPQQHPWNERRNTSQRTQGRRKTCIVELALSSVAQLAEHSTVNRRVTGSSPVGGANGRPDLLKSRSGRLFLCSEAPAARGEARHREALHAVKIRAVAALSV